MPAQKAALYEAVNMIRLGTMPLPQYRTLHPEARVSPAELAALEACLAPWTPAKVQAGSEKSNVHDTTDAPPAAVLAHEQTASNLAQVSQEFNGYPFDPTFESWKVISITDRGDNNTFRFILGNDIAVRAAASGNIHPWPDGTRLQLRDSGYHVMGCGKFDLAKGANWWGLDGRWRLDAWGFSDGINNAGKWDQLIGLRLNNNVPPEPYTRYLESKDLLKSHLADFRTRQKEQYAAVFPTPLPDEAYCDNWVTRNALNLLQRAPEAKPWFLQVNWTGPHDPEDITAGMERSVRQSGMPPVAGSNQYSPELNRSIRQNYTAMCENIDRGIGSILQWLETSKQVENAIVIFSSDHGEMLGDLGRWGKSVPYHASVGVPLIIAGEGVKVQTNASALVSSIDITATVLDLAGLHSATMDGRTLRPLLHGQTQTHRRLIYSGLGGWRMVTDGQWKVVTGFALGTGRNGARLSKTDPEVMQRPTLTFNLERDPQEMAPLIGTVPVAAQALFEALRSGAYHA